MIHAIQRQNIEKIVLRDDGTFPNNESLPVVIYRNAAEPNDPAFLENIFKQHGWINAWRDGVYDYHHYHSTAHEVLGVYKGSAMLLLGGSQGIQLELHEGDVIVIPAGVAHKCIHSSNDFKCVGAYPKGQDYDMNYGKSGERPYVDKNIHKVPMPPSDPLYGSKGPLIECWSQKPMTAVHVASREDAYRKELEDQLDDSHKLKNAFLRMQKNYKRSFLDKWITGTVMLLFEIAFYILFIAAAFITVMMLFDDPFLTGLSLRMISAGYLLPHEVTPFIMILKATAVVLSLFLLSVGLMLRGIRIRNNWIDNIIAEINRDIQLEENREKRIKNLL